MGCVRVRGELSGFKRAASGHLYFTLKDEKALHRRGGVARLGAASSPSSRPTGWR